MYFKDFPCPLQVESCIKSLLYKFRFRNKKDIFKCSLKKIIKAFAICTKSIKCIDTQKGGRYKVFFYEQQLKALYNKITISTIF